MTHIPDPGPLLDLGLAVFPIPAGEKRAERGWQDACQMVSSLSRESVGRVWPAGANIGVGCRSSWIVGLDLDQHDPGADGVAAFGHLCFQYRQAMPRTFTVRTPRGRHLYFKAPAELVIPSSICRVAPGIDVRAPGRKSGGYLVGPGSVVGGLGYQVASDLPIAPLPPWLAHRLAFTDRQTPYRPAGGVSA